MPTVSFDAQSLMIDGRRLWLVSGELHYARIPREHWRKHLLAARQAGLNCITTSIPWNQHELRPGVFDFEGSLDLRHFVKLIGELGLYGVLRVGPYVGDGYDMGGLPAWLHGIEGVKLRQAPGPFMEAAARHFGEVLEQVKDLQVTAIAQPGYNTSSIGNGGGPVILMQAEHHWFCHHPQQGELYLKELARYLRENGCEVPITLANNLWQRTEGTIDTWVASEQLLADMRQLAVVQPNRLRLVSDLSVASQAMMHDEAAQASGRSSAGDSPVNDATNEQASSLLVKLAQVLASGSQFNLTHFHGGSNFGFMGGRWAGHEQAGFAPVDHVPIAPLSQTGARRSGYAAIKRISTFASQFGHVLAALEPDRHHAAISLDATDHPISVIHQRGNQGQVVFIFQNQNEQREQIDLLLPNGLNLPVPLTSAPVQWLMMDVKLSGATTLDYTNLSPWALVNRKLLVMYGPGGSQGLISLNGAILEVAVPLAQDAKPWVGQHEGLTVVVLSEAQVDQATITSVGVVTGAASLDENDQPMMNESHQAALTITATGERLIHKDNPVKATKGAGSSRAAKSSTTMALPKLAHWQVCELNGLLDGSSSQYQGIAGPTSLEALQAQSAYGWYRLTLPKTVNDRALLPADAGRLHVYQAGKLQTIVGVGAGATSDPVKIKLSGQVVIFADQPGRFCDGWKMGEPTGLHDHFYAVKSLPLGKAKLTTVRGFDPWALGQYWSGLRFGDHSPCDALVWEVKVQREQSLVIELREAPGDWLLQCNGKAVGVYSQEQSSGFVRVVLHEGKGHIKPGSNELKLVHLGKLSDAREATQVVKGLQVYLTTDNLTNDATFAYAPWSPPAPASAAPQALALPSASASQVSPFVNLKQTHKPGQPCWFRTHFSSASTATPISIELSGMSKGQLYLNGRNLCRYWVGTPQGKPLPGQASFYLPQPWLRSDESNELMLFDEHGFAPTKCRLTWLG